MKTKLVLFLLLTGLLFGGHARSGRAAARQVPCHSDCCEESPFVEGMRPVLTADQAREWAQAWVQRKRALFPKWDGATVGEPTTYYDLDRRPAAYVLAVLRGQQDVGHQVDVGHVIVSYQALPNPVLAFGKGVAPHLRCPACVEEAALARQGFRLAAVNPIYLGPWDFYFEVEPLNAGQEIAGSGDPAGASGEMVRHLIPVSLATGMARPVTVVHQPVPQTWVDVPGCVAPGAIPAWVTEDVASATSSGLIFGAPDYDQFIGSEYGYPYTCASGCTPTAAANIVHFWDRAGYGSLAYEDWRDTTTSMRYYMGTWCDASGGGATYISDTSPGMVHYAEGRGFEFVSLQYCWPGTDWLGCVGDASWTLYTSQINRHQPVLISLQAEAYYDRVGHAVTGVGYDNDGGAYWIIHDNWPSTPEDVYVLSTAVDYRFYHTFMPPYQDTLPPSASILVPRYHQRDEAAPMPIPVTWGGKDNFSGVARYDVQYRQEGGEWIALYASTTYTMTTFAGQAGRTYTFRSRSYDWMGNVSAWATAQSTVYAYQVAGRVTGNRGHPVVGAQAMAAPAALNVAVPGHKGDFALYFDHPVTVDLAASAAGFGSLLPIRGLIVDRDRDGLHLVLPPADDLVANGHFESGLQGWQVNSAMTPTVVTGRGHTGDSALQMRMPDGVVVPGATTTVWQVTQTIPTAVSLSTVTTAPTLSWFYVVSGTPAAGDRENMLQVLVQGKAAATAQPLSLTVALPLTATQWTHQWLSLDDFVGHPITLTFGLQKTTSTAISEVLLDEVTLGQGSEEPVAVFLPVVARGW